MSLRLRVINDPAHVVPAHSKEEGTAALRRFAGGTICHYTHFRKCTHFEISFLELQVQ